MSGDPFPTATRPGLFGLERAPRVNAVDRFVARSAVGVGFLSDLGLVLEPPLTGASLVEAPARPAPAVAVPAVTVQAEAGPADAGPAEAFPADAFPAEAGPADAGAAAGGAGDGVAVMAGPGEAGPVGAVAGGAVAVGAVAVEAVAVDPVPADAVPADAVAVERVGVERVAAGPLGSAVLAGAYAEIRRTGFLGDQLRFERVRHAYSARAAKVDALYQAQGLVRPTRIFLRAFKREQLLEVWALDAGASSYVRVNIYPICGTSGELGPKRHQGDGQIPEGFYFIDLFNPVSNFHLSMRLDYPNVVDRANGVHSDLGGDIFIHGGCATIGCLPVTDRGIEEIYLMAARARDAGQERIPVHVFPTRLDEDGMAWLGETFGTDHPHYAFWQTLRPGHLAFEATHMVPVMTEEGGRYTLDLSVATHPGHYVIGVEAPSPRLKSSLRPASAW